MRERWPNERRSVAPNQRWLLSSLRVLRGIALLLVISCSPSAKLRSPCVFAPRLPDKAPVWSGPLAPPRSRNPQTRSSPLSRPELVGEVRGDDNNSFAVAND